MLCPSPVLGRSCSLQSVFIALHYVKYVMLLWCACVTLLNFPIQLVVFFADTFSHRGILRAINFTHWKQPPFQLPHKLRGSWLAINAAPSFKTNPLQLPHKNKRPVAGGGWSRFLNPLIFTYWNGLLQKERPNFISLRRANEEPMRMDNRIVGANLHPPWFIVDCLPGKTEQSL